MPVNEYTHKKERKRMEEREKKEDESKGGKNGRIEGKGWRERGRNRR